MKNGPVFLTVDIDAFVSRLRPGDILLFDSIHPLSELIKFAENRPVNHCTIYVGDEQYVHVRRHKPSPDARADPIEPAARAENLVLRLQSPPGPYDRTVTALRHVATPEGPSGAPSVVKRAIEYVEPADTTYCYLSLIAIMVPSLYRTYKKYLEERRSARRLGNLLQAMSRSMLDVFEADAAKPANFPHKKTLTCSEFVYRCYEEASPKLSIEVADPLARWQVPGRSLDRTLRNADARAPSQGVPAADSGTLGLRMRSTTASPDGDVKQRIGLSHVVSGEGLISFDTSFQTGLALDTSPGPDMRGLKTDLAILAGRTILDMLKRNVRLSKYDAHQVERGDVVADLVTPRDLWSSESLTAVSVLHRPPRHERDLDDVQHH